ncbi:hypothetical protein BVX95_01945 [archaeon D22]|nr:hypothetical protein BVX95_01945 [archaeon D22]
MNKTYSKNMRNDIADLLGLEADSLSYRDISAADVEDVLDALREYKPTFNLRCKITRPPRVHGRRGRREILRYLDTNYNLQIPNSSVITTSFYEKVADWIESKFNKRK